MMIGDKQDTTAFDALLDIPGEDDENDVSSEGPSERGVVEDFQREIDPRLVNAGWGFKTAKSVECGKTDQSLVNHVRNGVYALVRMNEVVGRLDGYTLDDGDLRDAIALFVIHDVHKLDAERDRDPKSRFDIPYEEIETYVEQFGLLEFVDSLLIEDFHSCAIDHHDDETANPDQSTVRFDDLRPFIRLADALASCETPEAVTDDRTQRALSKAYPDSDFEFRRHVLNDVKGIVTNLINTAVTNSLAVYEYELVLIFQDGCVYLTREDAPMPDLDNGFTSELLDELKRRVRCSHSAYKVGRQLTGNLSTRSQGFYAINDQDFFYAGPETVLEAVALKSMFDADPDSEPTESMSNTMSELEQYLPFDIERTREPVGFARLAYTIKRAFVDPVLDATNTDTSSLTATCDVFGVPEDVREGLEAAGEELSLTAGGKWDYAYGIGQALIDQGITHGDDIADRVVNSLADIDKNWVAIVEKAHAGNIRTELDAYIRDIVSVDSRTIDIEHGGTSVTDTFEQYHTKRRGKTCVLCNRGTTSTKKSDIEAPKSLTTLQAGYSNHIPVNAGKPDKLLVCIPCQIELSLRETGSDRREEGRLFVHLMPDYFYTPLSWRSYAGFMDNISGECRTELVRLAEAVLGIGRDIGVFDVFKDALLDEETGRSMVETLDHGFDPTQQYGARTLSYFKPKDNDTEFQFFGVFIALTLGSYTGLRTLVSESPIPDMRSRDFQSFALVDGGFTQVHDFYGTDIPLSDLQSRLRAAASLVRLGYGAGRDDALFAKHLRVTRNKLLPGSYLLKRIAQTDDGSHAQDLLEEARVLDEETGLTTNS